MIIVKNEERLTLCTRNAMSIVSDILVDVIII